MGTSRVFVGHLPNEATKGDLEHFFRHYGRILDVSLKLGYGFVDLENSRDAEDAIQGLNNKHLCGQRVNVEMSKSRAPNGDYNNSGGGYSRGESHSSFRNRYVVRGRDRNFRRPVPEKTRYRMIVENLTTRYSWQDLKDMMRQTAEVTFADAHRFEKNKALVCFASHRDLQRAMEKFQGKDINGRALKLIDDTQDKNSSSRSPIRRSSRSPRSRSASVSNKGRALCPRSVSRSRSATSVSPKKSSTERSPSQSRSKSFSPPKKSACKRPRSHSRSASSLDRAKNQGKHPRVIYENTNGKNSCSRSRSRSRRRRRSRSHSDSQSSSRSRSLSRIGSERKQFGSS